MLIVLGTLVGLLLAEGLVRLLPDQVRGYTWQDGVFSRPAEFVPDLQHNELGFHDVALPPIEQGTHRVLLLGDSYVAAHSVKVEQTVGQRLEHHLAEQGGTWRVVSGGGNGWGQPEERVVFEKLAPLVQPQLVLTLFVGENDVENDHPILQAISRRQIDALTRFRPGWLHLRAADAPWLLLPASELNRMVSYRLAMGRLVRSTAEQGMEAVPIDYLVYARDAPAIWDQAWERVRALLKEQRDLAHGIGAAYAVVSASLPEGVLPPPEGAQALVD
ncbi:MAG: SGNH/GDSL hydrolase family protein, partial [Oligoflexia bacterium]|nr:SGNH/GDSL hydrolase family protein [Oligoflexia bacterium]